jgi:hypothetical protein
MAIVIAGVPSTFNKSSSITITTTATTIPFIAKVFFIGM